MMGRFASVTSGRLALGPACVVLLMTSAAFAQDAKVGAVQRQVSGAEARVVKALSAKDSKTLSAIGSELGKIIEAALQRREDGGSVSACDMAAHSLAFVAVSAADGVISKGEARKLLMDDALAASSDFQKDMQACDKLAGKPAAGHTSVGKALRAL
ncbi:hypothetical protein ASE36_08235 [Rhizobium sp. Root274]|uniref:hypothetical protein n=1 Tax=unclassified Rhizobium TaxID=2613769 RepID=UPI0007130E05|nr:MULTISPECIES: hypothetical protein [unclassified Rhizobium]KQW32165.1 hypothetical protein ASC71_08245 [Rhizobium sp. Root1240]KRD33705.1 hypothetical protein ASE36_08235 [Rhizobium sp. Root274]